MKTFLLFLPVSVHASFLLARFQLSFERLFPLGSLSSSLRRLILSISSAFALRLLRNSFYHGPRVFPHESLVQIGITKWVVFIRVSSKRFLAFASFALRRALRSASVSKDDRDASRRGRVLTSSLTLRRDDCFLFFLCLCFYFALLHRPLHFY